MLPFKPKIYFHHKKRNSCKTKLKKYSTEILKNQFEMAADFLAR